MRWRTYTIGIAPPAPISQHWTHKNKCYLQFIFYPSSSSSNFKLLHHGVMTEVTHTCIHIIMHTPPIHTHTFKKPIHNCMHVITQCIDIWGTNNYINLKCCNYYLDQCKLEKKRTLIDNFSISHLQIDLTENDDQLRSLFADSTKESILLETGFRLPLCQLTCADIELLKSTIRDYHFSSKNKTRVGSICCWSGNSGCLPDLSRTLIAPLFVKHESSKKIDKCIAV